MSEKKIEDYLHLYLGTEVETSYEWISNITAVFEDGEIQCGLQRFPYSQRTKEFKLVLRPLSDMTEEEKKEVVNYFDDQFELGEGGKNAWCMSFHPEATRFLLSKHFDLFGLIDDGLAIDNSKITTHE